VAWIQLNATNPAPPSGDVNVHFQIDASHAGTEVDPVPVSANVRPFTGDSGSGGTAGIVPAPAAGDAAAGKVLKANGTWGTPSGGGGGGGSMTNPMSAPGDLIYGGSGGDAVRLAAGSAGQVLQTNGSSAAPTWVTPSSGGGGGSGWGNGEAVFIAPVLSALTQDNFGTPTVAETTPNGIRLREMAPSSNTNVLRSLLLAIPTATSLWRVTARLRRQSIIVPYLAVGLVLKDSVSGRYLLWGAESFTGPFCIMQWSDANSFSGTAWNVPIEGAPRDGWFRIFMDGTYLNYQYSTDGQFFVTVYRQAATGYLTSGADFWGLGIDPNNASVDYYEAVLDCFSLLAENL